MVLFPKALFLATDFPKVIKIQIFDRICIKKFHNFLKISQQFACVDQSCEKLTHDFVNFLKNTLKECIFRNFLKNFLKIFENAPASVGFPPPRNPPQARPKKVFPRKNPGYAHALYDRISIYFSLGFSFCSYVFREYFRNFS